MGVNVSWGQTSTWTYQTPSSNNTFGKEFTGSKTGLLTVQLGTFSEASEWEANYFSNRYRGVRHNSNSVTLSTEEGQTYIPTAGTFMIVKPLVNIKLSVTIYCYQKSWLYLVDADNGTARSTITSSRTNNSQQTGTATLTAGKTYYVYGDNNASNWNFVSFTAKTVELVRLETEISSAQALYDNDSYTEGKSSLNTAINTATTLSTNNDATTDDIIAGIKTLLEKEGEFLAANNNHNYIVSSNEYVYCGRPVKSVNGIVMTYGGKEGTNTWSVGTSNLTGSYTGNAYTNTVDAGAYGSNNGARCNGTETVNKLPNQGTYFTFAPSTSGILTVCMLYCSSRNMFFADSDKNTIDYYNPSSNYYGERAYKVEAGKTYYLWQDNNNYAKLYGFRFVPSNLSEIIGDINYTSEYNTVFGENMFLTNGTSYQVNFQNHGIGGSNNNENFHVYIKNSGETKAIMRADWWDDVANANTGFTDAYKYSADGGSTTTDIDWTTFRSDLKDANIDLSIAYEAGTVTIVGTATNGDHIYYFNFAAGAGELTGEVTLNLSVNKAWLEVLSSSKFINSTLASSGYSSLASAYGLDFSNATGLTNAFVVTNITKDAVTLTSVNELPANSGVILKGEANAAYSIPVKTDATYDGTNKLYAAVTAYDCAANEVYILQGGLFHLVTAASTVPAGKAYLKATDVPAEARSLGFLFGDDEATSINGVSSDRQNGEFYNLQGQRVDTPKKGLYIVNGTKVIIK